MKSIYILIFSLLFTACSNEPTIEPKLKLHWSDKKDADDIPIENGLSKLQVNLKQRVKFPVVEYNQLNRMGFAKISGYIENNTQNMSIFLEPITTYSKQWYKQRVKGNIELELPDSRLFNYIKLVKSDISGNFTFYNVPVGKYYIYTKLNNKFLVNIVEITSVNEQVEHNLTSSNKPFFLY